MYDIALTHIISHHEKEFPVITKTESQEKNTQTNYTQVFV